MKVYKVFREERGELVSAYEGVYNHNKQRKLHYKVGERKVDPKPDEGCIGLMVLRPKVGAEAFLNACGTHKPTTFVLCSVSCDKVKWSSYKFHGKDWESGYTDSIIVDRIVKTRRVNP